MFAQVFISRFVFPLLGFAFAQVLIAGFWEQLLSGGSAK